MLYYSSADFRWHVSGQGTAFESDWMNNALYENASFMMLRESTLWRWRHTPHHSDTIIVGRDPEILVPRPPNIPAPILTFFYVGSYLLISRKSFVPLCNRLP
jgi:fatty acid desaturase